MKSVLFALVTLALVALPATAQNETPKAPTEEQKAQLQEAIDGLAGAIKAKEDVDIVHFSKQVGDRYKLGDSKLQVNAVKALGRALKRKSMDVKNTVIASLGSTGGKAASLLTKELKGSTAKKNVSYLCDCVRSLGRLKDGKSVKTIVDLLKHKDNAVIGQAVSSLAEYKEADTKVRKGIVKDVLKWYSPLASAANKPNAKTSDKQKYELLYSHYEQTLQALSGKKDVSGAHAWSQWFRKEGSKAKRW